VAEDVARDRVEVLAVDLRTELLVEVVDRERPVDSNRRLVHMLDGLVRKIELVLDIADDLLEQILQRHDSRGRAVLVDDDGHVLARAAELGEQRPQVFRLRYDVRRAHEILERDGPVRLAVDRCDDVPHVDDAHDVVQRVAVDRIPGVRRLEHRRHRLLRHELERYADDVRARDHDVRDLLLGEVEDLVEHLAFVLLDLSVLGRDLEQHLQLCLRMRLSLGEGRVDADRALCELAGSLENPDQGLEDEEEQPDRG
jgi:hypothetical protein